MKHVLTLFALFVLAIGCGGNSQSAAPEQPQSGDPVEDARTLPIPGSSMPADHPPIGQQASAGLVWDAPQGWVAEQPASSMRLAQYRAPGDAGDGECAVFYFGTGQGGDPMSNAQRWASQFAQPDGGSSIERMQVTPVDEAKLKTMLVEVTGTYNGGMTMTDAPAQEHTGWMLLGGIVEGPDAPWFFKFTGPEATLRAEREAFVAMLRSARTGS